MPPTHKSDIRDFFGGPGGGSSKAKRKNVVDEDDDDEVVVTSKPKRRRTDETKAEGEEVAASEFFNSSNRSGRRAAASANPVVIDDDDDDDEEEDDVVMLESSPKQAKKAKPKPKAKAAPKAASKAKPKASGGAKGGTGLDSILASLPDCVTEDDVETNEIDESFKAPKIPAGSFDGQTVVITGDYSQGVDRDEIKHIIETHGGKVTSAISGRTTLVVIGENYGPKKIEKIRDNDIKSLSAASFASLLSQLAGGGGQQDNEMVVDEEDEDEEEEEEIKVVEPKKPKPSPKKAAPASKSRASMGLPEALQMIPEALENGSVRLEERGEAFQVPENAQPNCLAGLTIVFTGELPNLGRDEGKEIALRFGAKCPSAVSKSTSVVVMGDQAGPKKIENIKKWGIKSITESGFHQLLSTMPANGGDGDLAKKAMEATRKEQEKAEQEAERMAQEFAKEEAAAKKRAAKKNESQPASTSTYREASSNSLWTSRYAPKLMKEIAGNKSQVERLQKWLEQWESNRKKNFKVQGAKNEGPDMRAALLSGPPGIGKTTAAHVVANSLGYDVIESNASDTRSKKLLAETISHRLDNTSLNGYFNDGDNHTDQMKKICIIMDEVDGMSAGDRGGVGQMAKICRETKVPIILVCNERRLPKMRPFDKVTYDLPFRKPRATEVRARLMSICHKEGIKIDGATLDKLFEASGGDIRQTINMISTYAVNNNSLSMEDNNRMANKWSKNTALKPFDICSQLLGPQVWAQSNKSSFDDKLNYYFFDHDFAPLFIQENYLSFESYMTQTTDMNQLELSAQAAESISDGDLVDKLIHGPQQHWSLMPLHGVTSTLIPSYYAHGKFVPKGGSWGGFGVQFPSFLGKLSSTNKYKRLLQEIHAHVRLKVSSDKEELRQQYMPLLTDRLLNPLTSKDADVHEVISLMEDYYLTRDDWDVIMEMSLKDSTAKRVKAIPTATKTAFTRTYNQSDHALPFMKSASQLSAASANGGGAAKPDFEGAFEQDEPDDAKKDDDEAAANDDDITKDKFIKSKAPKKKKAATRSKKK